MNDLKGAYQELAELIDFSELEISQDFEPTFFKMVRRLKQVLFFQGAALLEATDERGEEFRVRIHQGFQAYLKQDLPPVLFQIYVWILNRGGIVCLPSDLAPGLNDLLIPLYYFKQKMGMLHVITALDPLQISQHQLLIMRFFAQQISRSLHYKQVLEKQEEDLQYEKMHSMGLMLSSIMHEINSPLTSIHGYLSLVQQEVSEMDEAPTAVREYVAILNQESKRLLSTVKSLLKYVRRQPLHFESVEMHQLLETTLALLEPELRQHSIQVCKDWGAEQVWIAGEASQIQQVFLNLMVNAIHVLQTPGLDSPTLFVTTRNQNEHLVVDIKDNGMGIPVPHLKHIFEPFYTTKRSGQGTGLGLSLSYKIITEHGGRIRALNNANAQGACFEVSLPLSEPKLSTQKHPDFSMNRNGQSSGRILLLEQEVTVLQYLTQILGQQGFLTTICQSGAEALERLSHEPQNLILTDFFLADMDGKTFFQGLQARNLAQNQPLLFITGAVLEPEQQAFLQQNHLQCLYKPFYAEELLETIYHLFLSWSFHNPEET